MVTSQEQELRLNINSYLKTLGKAKYNDWISSFFILERAYEKYLDWITLLKSRKQRIDKSSFVHLGNLWVLRELSFIHSSGGVKELSRFLKRSQVKQLSVIRKLSKDSALKMWENYYNNSAQFLLDMYKTLNHTYLILFDQDMENGKKNTKISNAKSFDILIGTVSQILADGSKLMAEEINRRRLISSSFYFVSPILILAIVFGLLALTGISDNNSLLNLNSEIIKWVVGIPIGLSVYSISLCLIFIRGILS